MPSNEPPPSQLEASSTVEQLGVRKIENLTRLSRHSEQLHVVGMYSSRRPFYSDVSN